MNHIYKTVFTYFLYINSILFAQATALDISVRLEASPNITNDAIILKWPVSPSATDYKIYRKDPSATSWGTVLATLAPTDSTYTDNTVVNGTQYEYRVQQTAPTIANGYILSGINTKLNYNNGIIILVVDSFFLPILSSEIDQLINDYRGDGYTVKQLNVNRTNSVPSVKTQIQNIYNQDPTNTKSIFLFGHIPVPYSGLINPDGHLEHYGAWPSDGYYGDMDGVWTDATEIDTLATDPRNRNNIGDGKFDQSIFPSLIELEVGRVDFYNLTSFSETETELMQMYLTKLHSFKTRGYIPNDIAVVEDNFSSYAEGFSASGHRSFATAVGRQNVFYSDWLPTLDTANALWSYGCGGGWYQGASGIATTTDFTTTDVKSTFTMLFGSYFGDWDVQNSFLRSALATGTVLTNAWAGRPHLHFHPMSLGNSIGYCTKKNMNNSSTYMTSTLGAGYFGRWVHIALLGDPSLRLHYIAPPTSISVIENASHNVTINWTASTETVLGYNVYRKLSNAINWTQLNSSIITTTSYADNLTNGGDYEYMVRAVRDQTTASGTYQNLSLGIIGNISSTASLDELSTFIRIYPNPTSNFIQIETDNKIEHWAIYTIDGKIILSGTQISNGMIDVQNLVAGIYILQVNHSKKQFVKL